MPAYDGYSLLNIPDSICQLLRAPALGNAGPLAPAYLDEIDPGVERVILLLVDALSLERLQRWMADGTAPVWGRLRENGLLAPLTSITPSTTSAALTSLWTGVGAAQHGITGYEMWLKEYGIVANTITHAPISFQGDPGSLSRAGFTPQGFVPLPTLGTHLRAANVSTTSFQHYSIARSGLSQIFFQDVDIHTFFSATDLWINLRQFLENTRQGPQMIWVYWSEIDTFSHRYGPDDERTAAAFFEFSQSFERFFLERLSGAGREGTLLILTADHGQITTRQDPHYELRNHPGLRRRLHIQPTGENRLAYLYIKPGQSEAVREYIERTWPNQFALVDPVYAVEKGLFGPGEPHPSLLERLGDLIVIAKGDAYLWWEKKENLLRGRHGGLSPQEMLVPFLAARL